MTTNEGTAKKIPQLTAKVIDEGVKNLVSLERESF